MCEEVTVSRERSARQRARGRADREHGGAGAHAAARRSGHDAAGVRRSAARDARVLVDRTPRSIRRRRSPSASRAGCSVAKSGINTPRRKRGEAQRARTSPRRQRDRRARARPARRRPRTARGRPRRTPAPWRRTCSRTGRTRRRRPRPRTRRRSAPRCALEASSSARAGSSPKRSRSAGGRQPHRLAEAAVAPARPVAADAALEQRDRAWRRARAAPRPSTCRCSRRRSRPRRPSSEPLQRGARIGLSGLLQPPAGGSVTPDLRIVRGRWARP